MAPKQRRALASQSIQRLHRVIQLKALMYKSGQRRLHHRRAAASRQVVASSTYAASLLQQCSLKRK